MASGFRASEVMFASSPLLANSPPSMSLSLTTVFTHLLATLVLWKICKVLYCVKIRPLRSPYQKLPQPPRPSSLLGNLAELFKADVGVTPLRWMRTYGGIVPFGGLFGEEWVLVTDPAALTHILVSHCYDFVKSAEVRGRLGRTLGEGLLFTEGDLHRRQRRTMNPSWSASNSKAALPTFYESAYRLRDVLKRAVEQYHVDDGAFANEEKRKAYLAEASGEQGVLDVMSWLGLSTLEIIGKCGFNYSFEVYSENRKPLADAFKTVSESAGSKLSPAIIIAQRAIHWLLQSVPFAGRLPIKKIQAVKACLDTMDAELGKIYAQQKREVLEAESGTSKLGSDFISLMIKANLSEGKGAMSDSEVKGQMSTMVVAGHETSSTLLSWILYELAKDPEHSVQQKLREEVTAARKAAVERGDEELSADELLALPFLDAVVREGLRFNPPVAKMERTSLVDVVLPLSTPITLRDGKVINELPLKAGTILYISVSAYNRSTAIFGPDADEFIPERWLRTGEKAVGSGGVTGGYGGMMSFSTGPRVCIGYRFATLEVKAILSVLIESFSFQERDIGGTPVEHGWALIMRPLVTGEESLGNRLPLRVTLVKQ